MMESGHIREFYNSLLVNVVAYKLTMGMIDMIILVQALKKYNDLEHHTNQKVPR